MVVKVADAPMEDMYTHFDAICDFIDQARKSGGVVVHCLAGISRSATAVIAYLMKSQKMTFKVPSDKLKKFL